MLDRSTAAARRAVTIVTVVLLSLTMMVPAGATVQRQRSVWEGDPLDDFQIQACTEMVDVIVSGRLLEDTFQIGPSGTEQHRFREEWTDASGVGLTSGERYEIHKTFELVTVDKPPTSVNPLKADVYNSVSRLKLVSPVNGVEHHTVIRHIVTKWDEATQQRVVVVDQTKTVSAGC